jgi:hypothetical protein
VSSSYWRLRSLRAFRSSSIEALSTSSGSLVGVARGSVDRDFVFLCGPPELLSPGMLGARSVDG